MIHKKDFILQKVGGENLLVPLGTRVVDLNGLLTLNETAVFLWGLLAEERSMDELSGALADRFAVDLEAARADVRKFVDELTRLKLLEL